MTVDLTVARFDGSNTHLRAIAKITGPASYATGGDPVVATAFRMGAKRIVAMLNFVLSNGTTLIIGWYDYDNQKVKFYDMAGAEIANLTNLSTYTGRVEVIGN